MRQLHKYIAIGLCMMMSYGCSDFLEVEAEEYLDTEFVFSNKETIEAFFVTTYASLPIEDFNYESGEFGTYPSTAQDNLMGWGAEIRGNTYATGSSSESWMPAYKNIRYCNILLDELPTASALNDEERVELIAEARLLRAYTYHFLVRIWGGVPLLDEPIEYTTNTTSLNKPRTSEEKIWEFIFEDLDYAIENMSTDRVYGRANRYVAMALKSRAALYAACIAKYGTVDEERCVGINPYKADFYFEESMAASKRLIEEGEYELYNTYPDDPVYNFTMAFLDARTSPEVILAKDFNYYATGYTHSHDCITKPWQFNSQNGEKLTPVLETVEAFEFENGDPADYIAPFSSNQSSTVKSLTALFAGRDPRLYASIVLPDTELLGEIVSVQDGVICRDEKVIGNDYGLFFDTVDEIFVDVENSNTVRGTGASGGVQVKDTGTGFFMRKYVDIDLEEKYRIPWCSRTDYIVFRLAETYLNFVEAAIETQTELPLALEYLNLVKSRAGVATFETTDQLVMERVMAERRSELCFEGFKFWDMVRRRTLLDEFDTSAQLTQRNGLEIYYDYTLDEYLIERTSVKRAYYANSRQYYQQIPSSELAKNNWPNNPGY